MTLMADNREGGIPASTVIAAAGLAGLTYLGYQYWWLPEKQRRAQEALLRAELARQAAAKGHRGPNLLDAVGIGGCMAAAQALGVPLPVSGPVCGVVGPQLPKLAYNVTKGVVTGTAKGVKTTAVAVYKAGGDVVGAVSKPFVKVGKAASSAVKSVGGFFEKIF
jgi:hypothetical protein